MIYVAAIRVFGGLKIDSEKVTSWNPATNDYVQSYGSRETSGKITHVRAPRPYIRIEESGVTGTTNITNSEIAYLGYVGARHEIIQIETKNNEAIAGL